MKMILALVSISAMAVSAGTAHAGGYAAPIVEAETIGVEEAAAPSGMGLVVPLLLLAAVVAVASSGGGSSNNNNGNNPPPVN